MDKDLNEFKVFCTKNNLKITKERLSIFKTILSIHHHFTIEELYLALKNKNVNVALSSIYRLIPHLINGGLIKESHNDKKNVYYEHICGHPHHDHLICIKCGKITEFYQEGIEVLQEHVAKKNNYEIIDHRLTINGLCSNCK